MGEQKCKIPQEKVKENNERERWVKGSKGTNCAWAVMTKMSYSSVLPV